MNAPEKYRKGFFIEGVVKASVVELSQLCALLYRGMHKEECTKRNAQRGIDSFITNGYT